MNTDKDGFYSFKGVWLSSGIATPLRVAKDGYQDPAGLPPRTTMPLGPGWREVLINGDTRFDMQLVRR